MLQRAPAGCGRGSNNNRYISRLQALFRAGATAGLLGATSLPAAAQSGPPRPRTPAEALAEAQRPPSAEELRAERAWPWYAGAWAVNAASTITAVRQGGAEGNPLFPGRPYHAIAAKGLGAFGAWRLEVWAAGHGHATAGKVVRWFWVAFSGAVAGYEFSLAF